MKHIAAALVGMALGCGGSGGGAGSAETSGGTGADNNGQSDGGGDGVDGGDDVLRVEPIEGALRIYIAGESIERRNRYVAPPFNADGTLNERGGGDLRNDDDEYGWSIPLADRLKLRYPGLEVEFVGPDTWLDAEDNPYSGKCREPMAATATAAMAPHTCQPWSTSLAGTALPAKVVDRRYHTAKHVVTPTARPVGCSGNL